MEEVRARKHTTGAKIAQRVQEIYRQRKMKIEFKNVQRRVYDALNVLAALNIIIKDKSDVEWVGIFQHETDLEYSDRIRTRDSLLGKVELARLQKFSEKK